MSKADYDCHFNLDDCIKRLRLDEKGMVQQYLTNEVLRLSSSYIPLDEGTLRSSGRVENDTEIVWGGASAPYAHYMWGGIIYEDPLLHCAGFQVKEGGWKSRKNVKKVPTERELTYQNGSLRGAEWVDRMLQNGGREKIEKVIRMAVGK